MKLLTKYSLILLPPKGFLRDLSGFHLSSEPNILTLIQSGEWWMIKH